jgi:Protein of unknown function (DUF3761)
MNFRRWITVLALFGLLLPFAQSFGQTDQQARPNAAQTTQTDKSKAADKKQSSKTTPAKSEKDSSKPHYYTNSAGQHVQSPTKASAAPEGATAQCRDGSYSFSQSRRGTCSHHGGVAKWLTH